MKRQLPSLDVVTDQDALLNLLKWHQGNANGICYDAINESLGKHPIPLLNYSAINK
jgi:hypothetical protein